ncbi:MAG: hypothetical protein FGM32_04825 [Candidatus Kapabacteria bacterium]|nr:hypothetical protein [Candidatus Kapabacteria bacterium]
MRTAFRVFCVVAGVLAGVSVYAQEETLDDTTRSTPWVTVSGSASVSSDFYEFTADPLGSQRGRRPPVLHRLLFAPTITIGGFLTLPLNLMITYPETNTTTPTLSAPSLQEFFSNPANALGLSSFSPKFGWAQIHLGSHTPKMSELSGGDLQLFGGGFDLRPGPIQLAASAGVTQRAVEPDAVSGRLGAYRREMIMARVGFGTPDTNAVGINVVYAKDDTNSIRNNIVSILPSRPFEDDTAVTLPPDTLRLRAEEGFIASLDTKLRIAPGVTFSAEGAVSVFTRDQRADTLASTDNPLAGFFVARTSTRIDGAGSANLSLRYSTWGITFTGLYMGAGFQPLAYPFIQSDRIDLKVSPMLNLLDGDFTLSGTIGQRVNNLSQTKGEAMTQAIVNGQLSIRLSDVVSLSSAYSNFGIRNNRQNPLDSQRIQNVSESFSIDPMIMFSAASMMHTITASIGVDRFDDFNIVSGVETSNDTRSATLSYTGMFEEMPLTIGALASYLDNALSAGTLTIQSYGVNASYRLLGGKLLPTVSLTLTNSTFGANPADAQTFLRGGVRWRAAKNVTLVGNYGVNSYTYGVASTRGSGFTEQTLQLSVSTTF